MSSFIIQDYIVNRDKLKISTHTLTWSVTSAASVIACAGKYFNSHAHVERDQSGIELAFAKDISTHTLTWSVTRPPSINMRLSMYFNSHAHVERDTLYDVVLVLYMHFNSHAHVERDDTS